MPRFEVTAPDGKKFEVNGPEGSTQDDAIKYIQSQHTGDASQASPLKRFAQGLRDPLDAGAQMLSHALPDSVTGAVNKATQYVNDLPVIGPVTKALGMTPATTQELDQSIAEREQQYQAARQARGSTGIDALRATGNVIAQLPLAAGGGAATLPGRIAQGASIGGASGSLQPVTQNAENFATGKGKQVATGAALGGALAPVAGGIARMVSPNTRPEVQTLMKEGVTPTFGQILGGVFQRTEDKLSSLPILGDAIKYGQRNGVHELNRAVYARALEPIGGEVPKGVGRGAVADVQRQLSEAYTTLLPKLQFKADNQFAQELSKVQGMASSLPEQQANRFEKIIRDQVVAKLTPQGNASGESFKAIESELGRLSSVYKSSSVADDRLLSDALREVQSGLRKNLARVNPAHADELDKINQGYSIYATIRNAASRQGANDGIFTAAQLAAAVRAGDKSVGKGNYAKGTAKMQDMSDAAKSVLGSSYPDSGTTGRLMVNAAVTPGYMFEPTLAAGLAGASAPYLPVARNVLAAILAKRPEVAKPLAQGIRNVVPAIGATGAPAVYQGASNQP